MSKRLVSAAVAVAVIGGGLVPAMAVTTATPPCTGRDVGGAWPSYGHDPSNSRNQPAETALSPQAVSGLTKAWSFTTDGGIESPPVVAHNCAYVTTTSGYVYAVDMRNGQQAWKRKLTVSSTSVGGDIPGSAAVVDDQVIVLVSQAGGPYAVSLDAGTGVPQWKSAPVSTGDGDYTNASAAVHNGIVVFGYSPPEGEDGGQGGVALLDAQNGAILAKVPTVSPSDQAQGYAGGGIWSTAAFDDAGYAYVGAGNPSSKTKQAKTTDAILKIDVDRSRPTFGQIVGVHQGEVDQYSDKLQQLSQLPACAVSDTGMTWPLDDPACGQLDLDFGASPNLFPDGHGGLSVGDLQKSGLYHAAHTTDMSAAWQTLVGASCASCNAASTAYDGHAIYVIGVPGSTLWALDPAGGSQRWVTPVGDGTHYQAISTADGVVYTVDGTGFLDAWSAADGTPLLKEPLSADAGSPVGGLTSSGVAIADGMVVATAADPTAGGAGSMPDSVPVSPSGYLIGYRHG